MCSCPPSCDTITTCCVSYCPCCVPQPTTPPAPSQTLTQHPAQYHLSTMYHISALTRSSVMSASPVYHTTSVQTPSSARTRHTDPHMQPHNFPQPLDLSRLSPTAFLAPFTRLYLTVLSDTALPAAATAALKHIIAMARSLRLEPPPTSSSNAKHCITDRAAEPANDSSMNITSGYLKWVTISYL